MSQVYVDRMHNTESVAFTTLSRSVEDEGYRYRAEGCKILHGRIVRFENSDKNMTLPRVQYDLILDGQRESSTSTLI